MQRRSIPAILDEIGALLEIEGENPFKVKAYYNAAKILAGFDDLDLIIKQGRLRDIKGIGETLSAKITEYTETGRMVYHEEIKRRIPVTLVELLQIPNLGPKKIKFLYDKLGVTNLGELEYACKENRLIGLAGFGERTQEKILKGIEFFRHHKGEFLFGEVYPLAMKLKTRLEQVAPGFVEICGSIRRRKEIVRDIDVLVASEDWTSVSSHFTSMPEVEEVLVEGETKTSCRLLSGINADLRIVAPDSYACALVYFTGNKEHNIKLRGMAKRRNYKLNEYGLFEGDLMPIALADEAAVYASVGLSFVPPELREDMGEIEAAQEDSLPLLIEMPDIKGVLHVHTELSDGADTLEAMGKAARKLGLSYVGISDHSRSAYYAGGLKADDVLRQWEAIDAYNAANPDFYFFKGIESDILPDGSLDYDEELLSGFDFVVASIHSGFNMSKTDMEARILKALRNPHTTILGHPTGRLLLARDGYRVDMKNIIEAAAESRVVIELNSSPYRLDIDWRHLKQAKEKGVLIAIDPDAHSADGLSEVFFGVGIARKGWLEAADVLNTKDASEVKAFFRRLKDEKRH